MTEPRRVAILGGTFDPVHRGHLALAIAARDGIAAAEAWLMPSGTPPLRPAPVASAEARLAMLEAAVRDLRGLRVDARELRRPGRSYTVDTLTALAAGDPDTEAWWVLGADAARTVRSWHRSDELLAILRAVIVQRAGSATFTIAEATELGFALDRTVVLDTTPPAVSATEVRDRIAAARSVAGLVPPAVAEIIEARGLYRARAPMR